MLTVDENEEILQNMVKHFWHGQKVPPKNGAKITC